MNSAISGSRGQRARGAEDGRNCLHPDVPHDGRSSRWRTSTRIFAATLAGGDLESFFTRGPDTFVYLLAPPPGCGGLVIDQSFSWDEHARLGEDVRPIGAYYTVRRWDSAATRIEILAVVHGDSGAVSAWVTRAAPGAQVALGDRGDGVRGRWPIRITWCSSPTIRVCRRLRRSSTSCPNGSDCDCCRGGGPARRAAVAAGRAWRRGALALPERRCCRHDDTAP